jgi:hypothetical protein
MDETPGRCISCGFLAHQDELLRSHEHIEVSPEQRAEPHTCYGSSSITGRRDEGFTSYVFCYLSKADLLAEVKDRATRMPTVTIPAAIEGVLASDRRCPYYCPYQVGLSPKEHLMERRLLGLEEDRRKFEQALDRGSRRLMWAALILGSLLAAGQILAAFFATPDGYGSRWFRGLWPPPPPPGMNDHV